MFHVLTIQERISGYSGRKRHARKLFASDVTVRQYVRPFSKNYRPGKEKTLEEVIIVEISAHMFMAASQIVLLTLVL